MFVDRRRLRVSLRAVFPSTLRAWHKITADSPHGRDQSGLVENGAAGHMSDPPTFRARGDSLLAWQEFILDSLFRLDLDTWLSSGDHQGRPRLSRKAPCSRPAYPPRLPARDQLRPFPPDSRRYIHPHSCSECRFTSNYRSPPHAIGGDCFAAAINE